MKMYSPYILLADDDPDDRESLIQPFLQQNPGVTVIACGSGEELLNFLETCSDHELPVLIMMDYKMSSWTAADVLERLQAETRYAHITKLVWSTSGRPEYVDRCVRHGASQYFTKPTSLPELKNIVDRMSGVFRKCLSINAM